MNINERVRAVRSALNLTQTEFGKRLAVAQSYLTNIETGRREVTEKIQKLICLEFNVSEEWLRTGTGEMFVESDSTIVSQLCAEYDLNSFEKVMIKGFLHMRPEQRAILEDYVKSLLCEVMNDEEAYKEFREEYVSGQRVLPFAARHGDASGLAEAVELYEQSRREEDENDETHEP